jgi:hypothetical protein
MEFGTNFWSMKGHLLCTTVHCCRVSEACMFSSPFSITSFCMDQCLSISICQILPFFLVCYGTSMWLNHFIIGFSIDIFFSLIKYMRLSENICILTIVHHNLVVKTYINGHIFKILGNKYAFECMQTHNDKLARIKDRTEMSRMETFYCVTDQYLKNVWFTYKIWVSESGECEGCGLCMFNRKSQYYSV